MEIDEKELEEIENERDMWKEKYEDLAEFVDNLAYDTTHRKV